MLRVSKLLVWASPQSAQSYCHGRLIWLGTPIHSTGIVNIARGLAQGLDASAFAIGISYERYERGDRRLSQN